MINAAQGIPSVAIDKTVVAFAMGDQWTNVIQLFRALPVLGISGLSIRDIMGYLSVLFVFSGTVSGAGALLMGLGSSRRCRAMATETFDADRPTREDGFVPFFEQFFPETLTLGVFLAALALVATILYVDGDAARTARHRLLPAVDRSDAARPALGAVGRGPPSPRRIGSDSRRQFISNSIGRNPHHPRGDIYRYQ